MRRIAYDSEKLSNWLDRGHSDEELQRLFLSMDLTMKYIHNNGYIISDFRLSEIELLEDEDDDNGRLRGVNFKRIVNMPQKHIDEQKSFDELIRENIYSASFIAIGTYTNCLPYLKPKYLKENFDSFATFIPEGDIPYYRGIIERGASVYYSDYVKLKREKEIGELEKESGLSQDTEGNTQGKGFSKLKSNGHSLLDDTPDLSYNAIYGSQFENKSAAFLKLYFIPGLILLLSLIIPLLICIMNMR